MPTWVAYFRFKAGASLMTGLEAFERRKSFLHPQGATVLGEFWVNAPDGLPQVVLAWESADEAAGDYYEAAWGDLFDVTIASATQPVSELSEELRALADQSATSP